MDLSLAKLLNELQLAETIIKQQAPPVILNFEIGSSSKSRGGKNKKKAKKSFVGGATTGVKNPKGKCYYYKKPKHHKKQCPGYLTKLNNKPCDLHLLFIETLLAAVTLIIGLIRRGTSEESGSEREH
ncbi:uncharacterized protein [Nicotiana sylvestris]|uniref:Gag/pol protein n=2 Tax=Nicotiana TaxID=4085 RepID=A0A1S4C0Y5_TOBAC|nr:PREDICTED: uncharacterized protein LOC104248739 [Nicotiana sylvestris]XP_016494812.1 PREDICTED: uncharacterized protein LOC107814003 [Nicotiana tabacum]